MFQSSDRRRRETETVPEKTELFGVVRNRRARHSRGGSLFRVPERRFGGKGGPRRRARHGEMESVNVSETRWPGECRAWIAQGVELGHDQRRLFREMRPVRRLRPER